MPSERDCVDHLLRVAGNPRLSLPEVIALGFLVARKWDRARAAKARADVTPTEAARFDNFTQQELDDFRASASRVLVEHAEHCRESAIGGREDSGRASRPRGLTGSRW
jgi:hypothetical protein